MDSQILKTRGLLRDTKYVFVVNFFEKGKFNIYRN